MTACNKKATLRETSPTLPLACLTACTIQLDALSPDQIAQAAFLGVQTHLRLNISGANQMRTLVMTGIEQAANMSALCVTQLMFAAVSTGGNKPAMLQV